MKTALLILTMTVIVMGLVSVGWVLWKRPTRWDDNQDDDDTDPRMFY